MTPDETRAHVADAMLTLIGRRGLDAVSFSTAAEESGVSRGLVQHLFGSRDALMHGAAMRLRDRIESRLPDAATSSPERRLRALLTAVLPDSEQAAVEAVAAAGLLALVRRDPELRDMWIRGRALLRGAVETALRECGLTTNVSGTASALLGSAGDLRDAVLIGEVTVAAARRRIGHAVTLAVDGLGPGTVV